MAPPRLSLTNRNAAGQPPAVLPHATEVLGRWRAIPGQIREHGFRTMIQGVTMHRPNEPGYSAPGLFVLDDWR